MDRRTFLGVLAGVLAGPRDAEAQAARIPKIGYLSTSDGREPIADQVIES